MSWQQLHLQCNKANVELAEALLLEEGAISILLEDAGDEPLFEPLPGESPLWQDVIITAFFDTHTVSTHLATDFEQLANHIATQVNASRFWLSSLEDKDWTREWMSHYRPIQCSQSLWIVPKWLEAPDTTATNIIIDPGLAFGTGYHATTRLCLDWLATQNSQGQLQQKTVLDYGCGSGILAVGALLLGAKEALAVDIDPQAILATNQNAQNNRVDDKLQAFLPQAFVDYRQNHAPDIQVITANILAKPLIEFAPLFAQILKKDGTIVLAGLIQSQVDEVLSAYAPYFDMDEPFFFDNNEDRHWYRLSGKRK